MITLTTPANAAVPGPAAKSPADGPTWGAEKPADGPVWGEGALSIPVKPATDVTFTPYQGTIAIVGNEVWDLKAAKPTGVTLEGTYANRGLRALSKDGKFFAAAIKTPNIQGTPVQVWSTETGKVVLEVPAEPKEFVDLVRFAGPGSLVIAGRTDRMAKVWNIDQKKMERSFKVGACEQHTSSVTPDGRYLAAVAHEHLVVYDIRSGREAMRMKDPPENPPAPAGAGPVAKAAVPARGANLSAIFLFASTGSIEFSPDGKELVAVFGVGGSTRMVCWDTRGTITLDQFVPVQTKAFDEDQAQWLPDGSGWLVGGRVIIERKGKRAVYIFPVPRGDTPRHHFLDNEHLVCPAAGGVGAFADHLGVATIPWDRINASLAAMNGKGPALLRPTQAITVKIELADLRGDAEEVNRALTAAATAQLRMNGISIADGQSTVLSMKFAEAAGEERRIVEKSSPFDMRGRDTGRTATGAKGSLLIQLRAAGNDKPIWERDLAAASVTSFREQINDASIRKSMLVELAHKIQQLQFPYFIPSDASLPALPILAE
jgi:hypothetical protein